MRDTIIGIAILFLFIFLAAWFLRPGEPDVKTSGVEHAESTDVAARTRVAKAEPKTKMDPDPVSAPGHAAENQSVAEPADASVAAPSVPTLVDPGEKQWHGVPVNVAAQSEHTLPSLPNVTAPSDDGLRMVVQCHEWKHETWEGETPKRCRPLASPDLAARSRTFSALHLE